MLSTRKKVNWILRCLIKRKFAYFIKYCCASILELNTILCLLSIVKPSDNDELYFYSTFEDNREFALSIGPELIERIETEYDKYAPYYKKKRWIHFHKTSHKYFGEIYMWV